MHYPEQDSKKKIIINEEGQYKAIKEWILETDGVNLMRVLSEPSVDPTRTTSNHIVEIFSVSDCHSKFKAYTVGLRFNKSTHSIVCPTVYCRAHCIACV